LYAVTGNVADKDRFKAPTLRNIAHSAPYMHDGSLATLDDVIDFYAAGGRVLTDGAAAGDGARIRARILHQGLHLTAQERQDLLDFLSSLTDTRFMSNPHWLLPTPEIAARAARDCHSIDRTIARNSSSFMHRDPFQVRCIWTVGDRWTVRGRLQWSQITPTSARWEQSQSSDGGKTWEPNWIMTFQRK
jgi:hypothetical protein